MERVFSPAHRPDDRYLNRIIWERRESLRVELGLLRDGLDHGGEAADRREIGRAHV